MSICVCVFFFLKKKRFSLSLNWVFALFVVFGKDPPSARKELIIRVAVWLTGSAFLFTTATIHVYIVVNVKINVFEFDAWSRIFSANNILILTLRLLTLMMVAFLFISALCSLVVMKSSSATSISSLQGMRRLLVVSVILLCSVAVEFSFYVVEAGVSSKFMVQMYLPDWIDLGLSKLFLHSVETCCLLYICLTAAKKFIRPEESRNHLRDKLLNKSTGSDSDDTNVPLAYRM